MIDYTALVRLAIADMARAVPTLRHIDASRVGVVAAPRVSPGSYGNLAQCHALRQPETQDFSYWYERATRRVVRATPWTRQENTHVTLDGAEMLYVVLLRLPRLLGHDATETIVHELLHIGPSCDGRMRKMRHGKRFDAAAAEGAARWRRDGDPETIHLLDLDFESLTTQFGSLIAQSFGPRFVSPRLVPLPDPPPMASHPDFARKRLRCDPDAVEMVEPNWTPDDAPAHLTERDLVYRVYTPTSAGRISTAAVRAAKNMTPRVPV